MVGCKGVFTSYLCPIVASLTKLVKQQLTSLKRYIISGAVKRSGGREYSGLASCSRTGSRWTWTKEEGLGEKTLCTDVELKFDTFTK
jgi:hypothetical protein